MSGPEFSIPHREGSRATGLESSFAPFLPECFCWGYGGILLSAESSRSNRALNATKAGEGDGARTRNLWIDKPVEAEWLW